MTTLPAGDAAAARTPLFEAHVAAGARMVPFAGFEMPIQYDGIVAEHTRVRTAVGLFDVSHMGEIWVRGDDAVDVVNGLVTNDLTRVKDGRAQYSCLCAPDGTIVDDLIAYRVAPGEVLLCVNASNRHTDLAHIQAHRDGTATITDESDDWAQIAVQGPHARTLLGRVFGADAEKLRPFRVRRLAFEGGSVLFATTGYTGEAGGEIYAPNALATTIWAALMAQGADLGVGPVGLGARDTLRLEMGYCLYGNDIDRTTTPLEAGLGWVTRLDKPAFVGKDAIQRQLDAGVPRALVGIEIMGRGIPRQGYAVLHDGAQVGHVTSGTRSPTTGRNVGLAYVPTALAVTGTALTIDCRGKHKPAVVVETPFYTPA